jgi:hypothetical protein
MSDILLKLMAAMSVASVPIVGTGTGFTDNAETIYGTPDYTITTFPSTGGGVNGTTDTIVAVDLTLAATDDGILFDLGGNGGAGFSAGFENGNLRVRAFSASGDDWGSNTASAQVEIDLSNSQFTGADTTYYFVADFSAGTLEVYAQVGGPTSNNEIYLLGSDTATGFSNTYGSNDKGYGQVNSSAADLGTNYEVNFNGTIDEIRIWTEDATLDSSGFPELPSDTTPNPFTFTDVTNVAVSTTQTSNTITVSGMDTGASATVTVTGGTYSKNSGAYTSASGTAQNNDTFNVRHTSSASNSTATNTTLTIGGISDTYTSTTEAAATDVTPSNTSWWNNIDNENDTNGITNTVTIAGINTTITLEISFNEDADGGFCSIVVNSSPVASAFYTDANSAATTFTVGNGDTVYFSVSTVGGDTSDATATVRNTSDSNTVLDTFTILLND